MFIAKHKYTYGELREELSSRLNREKTFPQATLSRWMRHLDYPKGLPGRKRKWDEEDVWAFCFFHHALHNEGLDPVEARDFTIEKIKQWRISKNGTEY